MAIFQELPEILVWSIILKLLKIMCFVLGGVLRGVDGGLVWQAGA